MAEVIESTRVTVGMERRKRWRRHCQIGTRGVGGSCQILTGREMSLKKRTLRSKSAVKSFHIAAHKALQTDRM